MRIFTFSLIFLYIFLSGIANAQMYEGSPCTNQYNNRLKSGVRSGIISDFIIARYDREEVWAGDLYKSKSWATSILIPTTGIPKVPNSMNEENMERFVKRDAATCRYSPFYAYDGKTDTAWSEGVPGDGIGEILLAPVDTQKPIEIFSGFGKSEDLFRANNRPKDVQLYIFEVHSAGAAQVGFVYQDIRLVTKSKAQLKDTFGYQTLTLPKHSLKGIDRRDDEPPEYYSLLAIEILSVYKGSKYDDTLISEIKNQ